MRRFLWLLSVKGCVWSGGVVSAKSELIGIRIFAVNLSQYLLYIHMDFCISFFLFSFLFGFFGVDDSR